MYTPPTKRPPEQKPQRLHRDWVDRLTLGTAVVGIIIVTASAGISAWQAIVATRQQLVMQKQLNEMQASGRQTDRAIAATNRLADQATETATATRELAMATERSLAATRSLVQAGRQGNEINRIGLLTGQRAFMSAISFDLEPIVLFGIKTLPKLGFKGNWVTNVNWTNSGGTPAVDLIVVTNCVQSLAPLRDPCDIKSVQSTWQFEGPFYTVDRYTFGPHQTGHAGTCGASSIATEAGADVIFCLMGKAVYRDVFSPRSVHITEFCFMLSNFDVAGTSANPTMTAHTATCVEHNCADDECSVADREVAARELAGPFRPVAGDGVYR